MSKEKDMKIEITSIFHTGTDVVGEKLGQRANENEYHRMRYVNELLVRGSGEMVSISDEIEYKDFLHSGKSMYDCETNLIHDNTARDILRHIPVKTGINFTDDGGVHIYTNSSSSHTLSYTNFMRYFGSYSDSRDIWLLTNVKDLLDSGLLYDLIPFSGIKNIPNYTVTKCKMPMYVLQNIILNCKTDISYTVVSTNLDTNLSEIILSGWEDQWKQLLTVEGNIKRTALTDEDIVTIDIVKRMLELTDTI